MESINNFIELCDWAPSHFLFFSENVFSPLVYYSHLFPVILSLIVVGIVYFRNRHLLANKTLLITTVLFSLWSLFDLILWATPNPNETVFFWSIVNMLEPLVYFSSFYLLYAFINNKLPSNKTQLLLGIFILPSILLGPSVFNIAGLNFSNCDREAVEGLMVYLNYAIEIIFALSILTYGVYSYKKSDKDKKRQIFLFTLGLFSFLFFFAFGNIIGSISENWVLGQLGLFGLPVFVAFLSVLIGKYHSFKTNTFYAEILVVILWVLILSMLFIQDISLLHSVLIITLFVTIILGISLMRSVRREAEQKDSLERLKNRIEISNDRLTMLDTKKNEFLSFATHQLRSPLTSIKWGLDSLKTKYDIETVSHLKKTTDDLIDTVNDLLDISKIEQGGMVIKKEEVELLDFIGSIVEEFKMSAEKKGLNLSFEFENSPCVISADPNKLRQVFVNLIDNSIKYTEKGSVVVSLLKKDKKVVVTVSDTGPGISKEELKDLFDKFLRGAAGKASKSGSGLGLYLAKKIIETHHGNIFAHSDGQGKGSQFYVELPR